MRLFAAALLISLSIAVPELPALAQTTAAPNEFGNCSVTQYANCDSGPDQGQLELPGTGGAQDGNWDDLTGGVSARPFVRRLSLINGGVETVLLENGTTTSALSNVPGSVGVVITPTNLCDSTETPGTGCYASPNRIQVSVVYRKSAGQVGSNLSAPNDGHSGTSSGNILTPRSFDGAQVVTLDENTTIDLTLALNTLGTSLRWTWVSGVPSFWELNSLGQASATARIKFRPALQPALYYQSLPSSATLCTAIPVSQCDLTRSNSDWLGATMILSLDQTLSGGMTGALFATEGAIIGSVDVSTAPSTALPQLVYGLSSSHEDYTGTARSSTLRAFVPAAAIVQVLGMPSFGSSAVGNAIPSEIISVARVNSTTTPTPAFEIWSEETNGENGLFITVSGITFSAPQYQVKPRSGVPKVPSVRLSGGSYSFTIEGNTSGALASCQKDPCSVTLYRASSNIFDPRLARVASKPAKIAGRKLSAPFTVKRGAKLKRGTRLLAVVTGKNRKVLASTPVVLSR